MQRYATGRKMKEHEGNRGQGGERWHDFATFEPRVDLSERTENLGTPYAQGAVADTCRYV